MEYTLDINDRPFKAIAAGIKKVEGRTLTRHDKTPFDKLKPSDSLLFVNNVSNEVLKVKVVFVHHYPNVREMLEKEGVRNVISSEPKTIEHGIESYNSLAGYKEGIKKNGIYAIGLGLLENFYDKVAKKLGGYGYGNGHKPVYKSEYPSGDPEKIFKEKLLGLSDKDKIALDTGCADGKFTLSIASSFQKIWGIDISKVNLEIAKSHNNDERGKNVEYSLQDASHTSFMDSFFDVVYCRRGPTYYTEYHRVLKTNGYYLEIEIGEMDTIELKKIFGRGQEYGKWDHSKLDENLKKLQTIGFKVVSADNFNHFEYYPSYKEFDLFLQGVPIFEDFNSKKDKKLLQKYIDKFQTKKGIQLSRHRTVILAQKI